MAKFERLSLDIKGPLAEVVLNRPSQLNAMDDLFFEEMGRAFEQIDHDDQILVAVVWAEGKVFSAGLDLKSASGVLSGTGKMAVPILLSPFAKHPPCLHSER